MRYHAISSGLSMQTLLVMFAVALILFGMTKFRS
jgi:Sec-independent protein translocase protein TatA